MPLSLSEHQAIWRARQYYFNTFLELIDQEAATPAEFHALVLSALLSTRDRIKAEEPGVVDDNAEKT